MTPKYVFRIKGNQENKLGNPIPYFRRTARSKFSEESKRYDAWKDHVRGALYGSLQSMPISMVRNYQAGCQPIFLEKGEYARMDIIIGWADEHHADPDNVFKGIADALFYNDKHLAGSFEFMHTLREGFVDVNIWICKEGDSVVSSLSTADLQGIGKYANAG